MTTDTKTLAERRDARSVATDRLLALAAEHVTQASLLREAREALTVAADAIDSRDALLWEVRALIEDAAKFAVQRDALSLASRLGTFLAKLESAS